MIDPLSIATDGYFTSGSYENMYPITLSTVGYILGSVEGEDVTYGVKHFYTYDDVWRARIGKKEKEKQTTQIEATQVEYQEPAELIQAPPLALNIQPIGEIKEDQALIKELRRIAILEHAQREQRLEAERQELLIKYKKRMRVMLALLLDED